MRKRETVVRVGPETFHYLDPLWTATHRDGGTRVIDSVHEEREACALICESWTPRPLENPAWGGAQCARAIRSRGEGK